MKTLDEVKSQFQSLERLKRGGQKTVYKAIQNDGTTVAFKVINDYCDARVLQEIEILKKLHLMGVPKIIESGIVRDTEIDENLLYIIEEFLEGTSLREWLDGGNIFNLRQAIGALEALLNIECSLEKKQILHRDINPNNIILSSNMEIYLIDFGLAKILGGSSLTQTMAHMGPFTPGYAPHEQVANIKLKQDVRTDLFQIGVTIYECCTGKNPFKEGAGSLGSVVGNTCYRSVPVLSLAGDIKGEFGNLVNMMMAKNQSQRPDSAQKALKYLELIKSSL